jgi:predicted nucleotidyltransferase
MISAAMPLDASLERLVRHVVATMHPLEVWLFGSRTENRARTTSDYDLLVVMPDETPRPSSILFVRGVSVGKPA